MLLYCYKHVYIAILNSYKKNKDFRITKLLLFLTIMIGGILLPLLKKTTFPNRKKGPIWFVYKWRVEYILELREKDTIDLVYSFLTEDSVVLDVGAHIGYYTNIFCKNAKKGMVYAFEPFLENYTVLEKNVKRYTNIVIENIAITDEDKTQKLYISEGHSNHSLSDTFVSSQNFVFVPGLTLDRYVQERKIKKIDLIKIDVEGNEVAVLTGMSQIIKDNPHINIIIEVNKQALESNGQSVEQLFKTIQSYNLECFPIENHSDITITQNYLLKKK